MATITQTQERTVPLTSSTSSSPSSHIPPPHNLSNGKITTHVLIDEKWYDLTYMKATHPGGELMIERMNGMDATDAFYSLHSPEAIARLKRMPSLSSIPSHLISYAPPSASKATLAFREFRAQLVKEGYFNRSIFWEAFYTLSVYVMAIVGTWCAYNNHPFIAIILVGLAMQQAGWIGHDYIHARGNFSYWNAIVMQWINGFSREWWSFKHNTHHVFTNYLGIDSDISNDPVFHLFFPDPKYDTPYRRMQHWYYIPVASLLYFSWRLQSIQVSIARRDWKELIPQFINYTWLYFLGWQITIPAIYIGGGLVALIVTATHQSEQMLESEDIGTSYSYVEGQFNTTRDATMSNFFMEWLWGGMQYQLEHHLFPTMPKYYFSIVRPKVAEFAKNNGLDYRCDPSQYVIWKRNYDTLKYYAGDAPAKKKQ